MTPGGAQKSTQVSLWKSLFALYGLYGLAIVKPILDVLGSAPQLFLLYGLTDSETLIFFSIMLLWPVVVGAGIAVLHRIFPIVARGLILVAVVVFSALSLDVFFKQAGLVADSWFVLFLSGFLGIVMAILLRKPRVVDGLAVIGMLIPLLVVPMASDVLVRLFRSESRVDLVFEQQNGNRLSNVLVVIFDEMPVATLLTSQGTIHNARFPSFGSLAQQSVWFRNTGSVGCYTELAVPAILSGRLPLLARTTPTYPVYPNTIFRMLAPTHSVQAWEPLTQLCPNDVCDRYAQVQFKPFLFHLAVAWTHVLPLPASWSNSLPDLMTLWMAAADRRAHEQVTYGDRGAQVDDILNSFKIGGAKPWLKVVHIALPHIPFEYVGTGQQYFLGQRMIQGAETLPSGALRWTGASEHANQNQYRHVLQAQYADRVLGKLMERMRAIGQWDNTVVVVTADHGVSHKPDSLRRETDARNYELTALVPLFLKAVDQRDGVVRDDFVMNTDIVPTVVGLLGARPVLQNWFDGADLLSPGYTKRTALTFNHACMDAEKAGGAIQSRQYPTNVQSLLTEEAKRADMLFGSAVNPEIRFGVHPDWLGKSPYSIGVGPDTDYSMTISPNWVDWDHLDVNGRFLPLHLTGRVASTSQGPLTVVATINGSVASVMPTIREGEDDVYSAMVESDRFHDGKNTLGVWAVDMVTGKPSLRRMSLKIDPAVPPP